MTELSKGALLDLEKFSPNLLNGILDLQKSAESFVHFTFGPRKVRDVIQRACEAPDQINQVFELIETMFAYLNGEINDHLSLIKASRCSKETFDSLAKRLAIFYEIAQGVDCVEELADNPNLIRFVDVVKKGVLDKYEDSKGFTSWATLPLHIRHFYMNESDESSDSDDGIMNQYAREDGVISGVSIEKASNLEDRHTKTFTKKLEKVLKYYGCLNPDAKATKDVLKIKGKFVLKGKDADSVVDLFLSVIFASLSDHNLEKEHQYLFMKLLKKSFMLMEFDKKQYLSEKLIQYYYRHKDGELPNLGRFIENFQEGLTAALNAIPPDHQTLHKDPKEFEKIRNEVMWYLMISPLTTLHQTLTLCVSNKKLVPAVMTICRSIPEIFHKRVVDTDIEPEPRHEQEHHRHERRHTEPLVIIILRKLFAVGRQTWHREEEWDNATYIATSFVKSKKKIEKKEDKDDALLDPYSLISFSIDEMFNKSSAKSIETFLKILSRLLANNPNNRLKANYGFSMTMLHEKVDGLILTVPLMMFLYDSLIQYDGQPGEITIHCRDLLKAIGGRLKEAQQTFDRDSVHYLTTTCFNNSPWWVKYAFFTWFEYPLQRPPRQIPSGVFLALPQNIQADFEMIRGERSAALECYLKSIFELGLFDVDCAMELLDFGLGARLSDDNVVEKIVLALVDCFGKRMAKKKGGNEIHQVIRKILKMLNPVLDLNQPLKTWSSSCFEAIEDIAYLMVLSKAVKVAFEQQLVQKNHYQSQIKDSKYDELTTAKDNHSYLVEIYCETAKMHVDQEFEEVQKFSEETHKIVFGPDPNKEGWKFKQTLEKKQQKILHQFTMLFTETASITRQFDKIPVKLEQLLKTIVDKEPEIQKSIMNKTLDDVLTVARKEEVVYAFAQSMPKVVEPDEKEGMVPDQELEPVAPSPHSAITPFSPPRSAQSAASNHSAENRLFENSLDRRQNRRPNWNFNSSNNRSFSPPRGFSNNNRGGQQRQFENRKPQNWNNNRPNIADPHMLEYKDRENFNRNANQPRNYDRRRNDSTNYDDSRMQQSSSSGSNYNNRRRDRSDSRSDDWHNNRRDDRGAKRDEEPMRWTEPEDFPEQVRSGFDNFQLREQQQQQQNQRNGPNQQQNNTGGPRNGNQASSSNMNNWSNNSGGGRPNNRGGDGGGRGGGRGGRYQNNNNNSPRGQWPPKERNGGFGKNHNNNDRRGGEGMEFNNSDASEFNADEVKQQILENLPQITGGFHKAPTPQRRRGGGYN